MVPNHIHTSLKAIHYLIEGCDFQGFGLDGEDGFDFVMPGVGMVDVYGAEAGGFGGVDV